MQVFSLIEHLTKGDRSGAQPGKWPTHFDTYQVVKALKGERFEGFATITVGGERRRLEAESQDLALDWAGERLGKRIAQQFPDECLALVPIPGHLCTSMAMVADHRIHRLASKIAASVKARGHDAESVPLLYWSRAISSAHKESGTRDPSALQPLYRSGGYNDCGPRRIVLIDDVVTTGARLCAAERFLEEKRFNVAPVAFVVARTAHEKGPPVKDMVIEYDPWPPIHDDDSF